jgi:hypothetical protein
MINYSSNTCNIITLYPLGVECSTVNAYSPYTTDGSIFLFITGGTPPYIITWQNGSQTQSLTNVGFGDYTATVVDYYGDFTATTTCTVGYDTFYIESFYDCNSPTNFLYYSANLENQILTGKTWTLASQLGCWVSDGLVEYTGQTYYLFTATTTTGPFDTCTECFPTTPEIENTEFLCLESDIFTITPGFPPTFTSTNNQYQFFSANTINGYPSWSSNTQTIYYNTNSLQWMVSGWTLSGQPVLQSNTSPPIGIWTFNGNIGSINVTQGLCVDNITLNTINSPATCTPLNNGVIQVTSVNGGTPPFTYSLTNNPLDYQSSPFFINLTTGTYTVYARDVIGNIGSKVVTVSSQQSVLNYQVNLNFVPTNPQPINGNNNSEITLTWEVSVQPPLPANKTITFDIIHATNISGGTNATNSPILIHTPTTGQTGGGTYLTSGITTTTNTSSSVFCVGSTNYTSFNTTATTRTYGAKITGPGTVGGQVFKKVTVSNSNSCPTTGTILDSFSIINVTLVNQNQCETLNVQANPISNIINRGGGLLAIAPPSPFTP